MTHDDTSSAGRAPSPDAPIELSLVGLHADGEHIILRAAGNTRFVLPITEQLQAAIRGDRSRLEFLQSSAGLTPREIQGRVRAGETAEQIAKSAGMPLAQVQRYERTVLDERAFVARQARAARLGNTADAPALGDLVTDRLAARSVDTSDLTWDAIKLATGGWQVSVQFLAGGADRLAKWRFHPRTQVLQALEDEARWLSETEIADEPIPRRHLTSRRDTARQDAGGGTATPEAEVAPVYSLETGAQQVVVDTEALLDDLAARRGVRQGLEAEAEAPTMNSGSSALSSSLHEGADMDESAVARIVDFQSGGANSPVPSGDATLASEDTVLVAEDTVLSTNRGAGSTAGNATGTADSTIDRIAGTAVPTSGLDSDDDRSLPASATAAGASQPELDFASPEQGGEPGHSGESKRKPAAEPEAPAAKAKPARRGRSQMPTWDEIVFGAKTD